MNALKVWKTPSVVQQCNSNLYRMIHDFAVIIVQRVNKYIVWFVETMQLCGLTK